MSKPIEDKNVDIPDNILRQLLTPSEIRMLKNRWQIIQLLEDGLTIRNIAERVNVGTDTVVRVSKMMQKPQFRKVWQKGDKKIKSQTPWVFGKND